MSLVFKQMDKDGGAESELQDTNKPEFHDIFMTDAIALIGYIYDYAKSRKIPAADFEMIIMRSYIKTMKLKEGPMPENLK